MKKLFGVIVLFSILTTAAGQSIGVGTSDPHASAALEVASSTQGVLVPRMNTTQRQAIQNAATGLLVFDVSTNSFWFKGGTHWIELIDSSKTLIHKNASNIFMGLLGFVGIGTTTPSSKLEVNTPLASEGIVHTDGNVRLATSTTADGAKISTTSNHPLILTANNSLNGILITPIGAVGIGGVIAPIAALEVKGELASEGIAVTDGNVRLATSTSADGARISTTSNHPLTLSANNALNGILITPVGAVGIGGVVAPTAALEVKSALEAPGIRHTDGNVTLGTSTTADAGILETVSDHPLHLNANGGPNHLVITPEGKVGVGLATPTAQLEVKSPANAFGLKHSDGAVSMATKVGSGAAKLTTTSNHPLQLSANDLPNHLTLATNGNVGVSTDNPLQKLHVNGSAIIDQNLGIGTATPHVPLQFASSPANRKISLWETADNDHQFYGFGVNPSTLRYQVDGPGANHVFYAASSPTASTELMRIGGNGNIGMKVTNPANRLDIHSGAENRSGTHASNRPLYVTGDIGAESNGIEFRRANGTEGLGFGYNSINASGSNANQDLAFNAKGTGDLIFKTSGAARLHINETGKVGIGTNDPHAELQLSNNLANKKMTLFEAQNNDHQFYGLGVNPSTLRYQVDGTHADHVFYAATGTANSNELMRIAGDGNVGIGTNDPSERLDVIGNVDVSGNVEAGSVDVSGDADINGQLEIGYIVVSNSESIPGFTNEENVNCACPPNYRAMGGGWYGEQLDVVGSFPTSDGGFWVATANNIDIDAHTLTVFAICARVAN